MKPATLALSLCLVAVACTSGTGVTTSVVTLAPEPVTTALETTTVPQATTTSSAAPATVAPPPPTTSTTTGPPECLDLRRDEGPDAEFVDVVLAAWEGGSGELVWEMALGTRMPSWYVQDNEVVLGFPDGQLVGVALATCDAWALAAAERILEVQSNRSIHLVVGDGELAGYSGDGVGVWRRSDLGDGWRLAAANGGVNVMMNTAGDLLGLGAVTGDQIFEWNNASGGPVVVAAGESFIYRSGGGSLTARPIGGGGVVWTVSLERVEALFSVPGTLVAETADQLFALEPGDGAVRWAVPKPFDESTIGPVVRAHNELHFASGTTGVWHLDPADGSVVFEGRPPAGTEWFPEMDDGIVLQVGSDGRVVAVDTLERIAWSVDTGANRVDRFTQAEVSGAYVVTLTFSAERF